MKASFFRSFGGPEVLQYGDLADPLPAIVEYPLAEAAAARRVSEARHLRGKLALRVR